VNAGALSGLDMAELDFSIICFDVDFRKRHHCHQGGADTHVVAYLHAALRDHSVHWGQNLGVGQIEFCLVALGFGLPKAGNSALALSPERLDLPLRQLQRRLRAGQRGLLLSLSSTLTKVTWPGTRGAIVA